MGGPVAGFPRLLALGDAAYTVEFGGGIAPEIHARVLGFTHPVTGERLRFEAPSPPLFRELLELVPG